MEANPIRRYAGAAHKATEPLKRERSEWIGQIRLGSVLLALYGFFSIFAVFFIHAVVADCSRELYNHYAERYPKEALGLTWSFESSLDTMSGLIVGFSAGLLVFVIVLLFVNSGITGARLAASITDDFASAAKLKIRYKEEYRDSVTGVIILLSYLGVFLGFSMVANPYFLSSYVDIIYGFVFAALIYQSAELYILFGIRTQQGRHFHPRALKDIELKQLELEHATWKEVLHLLTWVFIMLVIGVYVAGSFSWTTAMPAEILSSRGFRVVLLMVIFYMVEILVGFFVGILFQILYYMGGLVGAIQEYGHYLRSGATDEG